MNWNTSNFQMPTGVHAVTLIILVAVIAAFFGLSVMFKGNVHF